MSDLISRQAAIKEVRKMAITLYGYDSTSVIRCAIHKLQNMPSSDVQPHQITEEDLTELRHRFGKDVECVVRDMISGKDERWQNG